MPQRILHVLSQRPSRTGSGVTLEAMVRQAALAGWEQAAVVGIPAGDQAVAVGGLAPDSIFPLRFAAESGKIAQYPDLDMAIPGMSDVMPYPSTIWSEMTPQQLDQYRQKWRQHLTQVIADFAPDLIHSHHIWLVSSMMKDIAPEIPVVTTCHSTGLRQMILTPHLADEVKSGCARNDYFCVLRDDHREALQAALGINSNRIEVIGAGYRADIFRDRDHRAVVNQSVLYVGKLSRAKGLPWLLEAFAQWTKQAPEMKLHIAGSGAGTEADAISKQIAAMVPQVIHHGALDQNQLAKLMNSCGLCVLPSFYEGVPLVLVEAAACGCQIVATDLPGVRERILPHLKGVMDLVPLPRLHNVDQPIAEDLPAFTRHILNGMVKAQARAVSDERPSVPDLSSFTWEAVFERVQRVWQKALAS